jgi:acetyl-CoA acetyltransferase
VTPLRNVAVVGYAALPLELRDDHRTAQELLYLAIRRALAETGIDRDALDVQLAGSADYVDGKPFGFVQSLDVMGSWPPRQDSHLEMDAAFAAYYGWIRVQAGECDTAMVVGYGKNSEGDLDRVSNIRFDPYFQGAIGLDSTSASALQASAYMARTGATDADVAAIAARRRSDGARSGGTLVRGPVDADELRKSPWTVEPLRRDYVAPRGDGAVCLLLAAEGKAESMCERPAWILGVDQRAEMQTLGARDLTRSRSTEMAAKKALDMSGLSSARDVDVVELAATNPVEEMILREAIGLDARGDGRPAVSPSGGAFGGTAFLMTGAMRLGDAFRQLSGKAGACQVAGARRAIAHASLGECLQQNLVFVLGAGKPVPHRGAP